MSLIPSLCSACGAGGGSSTPGVIVQDVVLCDFVGDAVVGSAVAVYEYDAITGDPIGSPTLVVPGTNTPYVVQGILQPCTSGNVTGPIAVTQATSPWVVSLASTTITGSVTAVGTDTPADAHANPTTAVASTAFNEVFNGTTWDRVRSGSALGSLLVNNPTAANLQATVTQGTSPWVVSGTVGVTQSTSPWLVSGTVISNQGTSPWVVSGTVTANQGTSPWVVSLASTTITGSVAVVGADTPSDTRTNPTTNVPTTSFNEVFNGTTWDRVRSGAATGSMLVNNPTAANLLATVSQGTSPWVVSLASTTVNQGTSPWVVSGTVTANQGTSPWVVSGSVTTAITGADTPNDGRANPTTNTPVTAFNEVFNGTTWDRVRSGTATGSFLVNNPTAANLLATVTQGTSPWVVSGSVAISGGVTGTDTPADTRANPTTNVPVTGYNEVFNGTTWDRMRSGTAIGSVLVNNPTAANLQATVTQGTSPWVVSLASTTITGTVTVTGSVTLAGSGPVTSLNAQSTVQNGTALDDGGMHTHHTIVLVTSAGVSSGTVVFQVSQDNTNWFNAVTFSTTTASNVASADVTGAFRYCRAAITTAITGGTVTATVASV